MRAVAPLDDASSLFPLGLRSRRRLDEEYRVPAFASSSSVGRRVVLSLDIVTPADDPSLETRVAVLSTARTTHGAFPGASHSSSLLFPRQCPSSSLVPSASSCLLLPPYLEHVRALTMHARDEAAVIVQEPIVRSMH